jgi:beta-lysine 5,6-aminomutase alpha subunit
VAVRPRPRAAAVRYVLNAAGGLREDFAPAPDGFIATRARAVLDEAVALLERIIEQGLLAAIAAGTFGAMRRPPDGGRGGDGVVEKAADYDNPAVEALDADAPSEIGGHTVREWLTHRAEPADTPGRGR